MRGRAAGIRPLSAGAFIGGFYGGGALGPTNRQASATSANVFLLLLSLFDIERALECESLVFGETTFDEPSDLFRFIFEKDFSFFSS